jgi:uncharacterized coiled-coil DUF342 family protein
VKKIQGPENQIEDLNQELIPLKEERNNLNLQAKKWAEKRNGLHEKVKDLRKDASKIKEKRDNLNTQVQELKNLRDQLRSKISEKHEKIVELQNRINDLNDKKPEGNILQVEKEIKKIDWKIQTTSLPLKEEQELVNQVRQLETQLINQKQIQKVKDKLYVLKTQERSFRNEARTIHGKLAEIAEQSQKFHSQMISILESAREFQVEADSAHQKYIEARQQAQQHHQKCVELIEKIKKIEDELKKNADKKLAERQTELKKELEERALMKLKRGEKLVWEEFQILAEKGMI